MRKVWAIVRLTIAESIRTRVAIAFVLLLAGVMVLLISTASGDGTVAGKIQMFMSYSMGLTYFLLALLVIFLACRTLDQDIQSQRIDSLASKPLARWQLLLGRWLGIVLLALFLFILSMGTTYTMVRLYARSAKEKTQDKFKIDNQILVARRGFMPPLPDVSGQVEKRIAELKAQGNMPQNRGYTDVQKMIGDELIRQTRTVNPRQQGIWVFKGLPKPQQGEVVLTLRYKYEPSITTTRDKESNLRGDTIYGQWIIGRREAKNVYITSPMEKPYRTLQELNIPINAIDPDGSLTIAFINGDPREVAVHFPPQDGIEILVHEGTFEPNFIRTAIIIFSAIVFLTTLALACGTFLSFPIASLVALSAFFVGIGGNFLYEAMGKFGDETVLNTFVRVIGGLLSGKDVLNNCERLISLISLQIIPVLDASVFTSKLIDGRIIDWNDVAGQFGNLVILKAGVLAIFAIFVFSRRELGKITV
ncbi:MAG: ABC transporter permease [Phycisphaerae bacterium]